MKVFNLLVLTHIMTVQVFIFSGKVTGCKQSDNFSEDWK